MRIIFFAILVSLASFANSKEICIDSEKLQLLKVVAELTGELNQAVVFNLELIESNLRAISYIKDSESAEFIASLDEYQRLYLERIITAIDFQIEQGLEYDLYEERLGKSLETMKNKKDTFPVTINSPEFFRLSKEIEKKKAASSP